MIIVSWAATIIAIMYGVMSSTAGLIGYTKKSIPVWSALAITIVGIVIIVSSLLITIIPTMLILLITSLLIMHILAVINGFHMYGRIHIRHHLARLIISIIIIVLYFI